MTSINDKTAFQLGIDSISKLTHPRKHTQIVNERVEDDQLFLRAFEAKISRAVALCGPDSKEALSGLLDDIKFSDPISVEDSIPDEDELIAMADEFLQAAEEGNDIQQQSIELARRLLAARNNTCKRAK